MCVARCDRALCSRRRVAAQSLPSLFSVAASLDASRGTDVDASAQRRRLVDALAVGALAPHLLFAHSCAVQLAYGDGVDAALLCVAEIGPQLATFARVVGP